MEDVTDHDTMLKAQSQMNRCALALAKLAPDIADARTIKEFNSDRLKRVFSIEVARILEAGESVSASEHKARASATYGAHLADLSEQYKAAMRVIEQCESLKVQFESARSILSCEKTKLSI